MPASVARRGFTLDAVDIFAGFGGSSRGIHAAGAEVRCAANHNELAIDVHSTNFPETDHVVADLLDRDSDTYTDPADLPAARFLWASPSCRHHSQANSEKVYKRGPSVLDELTGEEEDPYEKSERSRATMLCPLRYAAKHQPEIVCVENVVEAIKWGEGRNGNTFKWWLREWNKLGYEYEILFLNSMFFQPCPQTRDRIYVALWRRGNRKPNLDFRPDAYCISDRCGGRHVKAVQSWRERKKTWPLPKYGKYGKQYDYRCPECTDIVHPAAWPAYSVIDWSDLGQPVLGRDKPLAPKTIERIQRGLRKFAEWPSVVLPTKANRGVDAHVSAQLRTQTSQQEFGVANAMPMPFLTEMRGGGSVKAGQHPILEPTTTVTAGGFHHGFAVNAGFTKVNGGPTDTVWHQVTDPLQTITQRDTTGFMVLPWLDQYRSDPVHVSQQMATVTTHTRHALANIEPKDVDLNDIPLENVRFRMLQPDTELKQAMGFEDEFILKGTKRAKTAGLGNAVTPPVADWITRQLVDSLDSAIDYPEAA